MIKIKPSKNADSRSAVGVVTKEDLLKNSVQHIGDVQKAMGWFAARIIEAGVNHDHTKISGIDSFHDGVARGLTGDAFKSEPWYQSHMSERHHLNDSCPDDVTIIDVIERIGDIVMAAKGRGGKLFDDTLSADILQKAYANTVNLLMSQVVVEEMEGTGAPLPREPIRDTMPPCERLKCLYA